MSTDKKKTPKQSGVPLDELHNRLQDLADQAKVIENQADAEHRDMTAEELEDVAKIQAAFKETEKLIAAREANAEMQSKLRVPQPRVTQPIDGPEAADDEGGDEPPRYVKPQRRRFEGGMPAGLTKGKWGFRSMGEFAMAAMATRHGKPDARILNAPSTYGSEGQNQDGGFAVPPDFREDIVKQVMGEESLLSRCDQQITQSNSLSLPLDTVSPWDTSTGVTTQWLGEGAAATPTKPSLGALETKLNKLVAFVALTDELVKDVSAMTRWLESKVPEKFTSALNTALVSGSGVGQPMGLLNASCKVIAAAKSGQGAGTVIYENIVKMYSRRYGRNTQNYIWLINQDVEPQLQSMIAPGATFPAYLPPGGLSASPYGMLMGRPVLPLEACSALGTEGDIIFFDPTQYLIVLQTEQMRADVSMHLYFDSDHLAFRFIMRVGGQPYWKSAISRQNGSNTLSPIITLNSTRT